MNHERSQFGIFLNWIGLIGEGAEIGVLKGKNSSQILNSWNGKKLYLIDIWKNRDSYYSKVCDKYKNDDRVIVLRCSSIDASKRFEDNSLDWVYIDANHSYNNVKEDIGTWSKKVKHNGIIAGHDYCQRWPGVMQAVDEYTESNNIKFFLTNEELATWYFFNRKHNET